MALDVCLGGEDVKEVIFGCEVKAESSMFARSKVQASSAPGECQSRFLVQLNCVCYVPDSYSGDSSGDIGGGMEVQMRMIGSRLPVAESRPKLTDWPML